MPGWAARTGPTPGSRPPGRSPRGSRDPAVRPRPGWRCNPPEHITMTRRSYDPATGSRASEAGSSRHSRTLRSITRAPGTSPLGRPLGLRPDVHQQRPVLDSPPGPIRPQPVQAAAGPPEDLADRPGPRRGLWGPAAGGSPPLPGGFHRGQHQAAAGQFVTAHPGQRRGVGVNAHRGRSRFVHDLVHVARPEGPHPARREGGCEGWPRAPRGRRALPQFSLDHGERAGRPAVIMESGSCPAAS